MKKFICILLIGVLLLSCCACDSDSKKDDKESSTYKTAVNNWLDVVHKGKVSKVKKLAPQEYWEYLEEEENASVEDERDYFEDIYEENQEFLEDEFGNDIMISDTILNREALSDDELDEIKDSLKEYYNIAKKNVKKAYEVELESTVKGSKGDHTFNTTIVAVNIKDDWYVVDSFGTFAIDHYNR